MTVLIFLFSLIVITAIAGIIMYNSIINANNLAKEAWSGIDTQLKRRYDLIPSLVDVVKGYSKHEKETLSQIVELRNEGQSSDSVFEKSQNDNKLSGLLKNLFALVESYPDLKANANYIELQKALVDVEDNLQQARRYYNATIRHYNTLITVFPVNLLANHFDFEEKEFFGAEDKERSNVKIDL